MRICFILGKLSTNGGIGRATSILANELARDDELKIHLLCYCETPGEETYPIAENVKLDYLLDAPCSMTRAMLFKNAVGKLKKYLKKNKIDVIVAAGNLFFPISIIAARLSGAKCICWEHSNVRTEKDIKFQHYCRRAGALWSNLCVSLTKQDLVDYKRIHKAKRIIQIYNPVDEDLFAHKGNYQPDTNKIISVGRLTYPKYYEKLIEVAAIVFEKHPEYSWDIYGDGEEREHLEALIPKAGLSDKLHLMGRVSDLYDRYKSYSLQVMTSRYEGFPMVLLEGAANGLPLVSYDIYTGPNEIIEEGKNGRLIEPFDAEKMAAAIIEIMENKALRLEMSKASLECVEGFRLAPIAEEWKTTFENL